MADDGAVLELQYALIVTLEADQGVSELVGTNVFDQPPQGAVPPYVRIGRMIERPIKTDGHESTEVTFSIEVYSRPVSGRVGATKITQAVAAALDEREADLDVVGHDVEWVFLETSQVKRLPDGRSYEGLVAFTASLQRAAE